MFLNVGICFAAFSSWSADDCAALKLLTGIFLFMTLTIVSVMLSLPIGCILGQRIFMPTDGSLADHLKEILTVHMVIFCALWQLQCDLIQIDFRSQTQILHIIFLITNILLQYAHFYQMEKKFSTSARIFAWGLYALLFLALKRVIWSTLSGLKKELIKWTIERQIYKM